MLEVSWVKWMDFYTSGVLCHQSFFPCFSLCLFPPASLYPSSHSAVHPRTSISPFPRLVNWFCWGHGKRWPLGEKAASICVPLIHAAAYTNWHTLHLCGGHTLVHNFLCCLRSLWHLNKCIYHLVCLLNRFVLECQCVVQTRTPVYQ